MALCFFPGLTWAAVAAVWRRRDSSHRHRATIRAISIGFSRYLLYREERRRMESSGRLRRCGPNLADLKLNSKIERDIYYMKQQNKGLQAWLQSARDEGEKQRKAVMLSCTTERGGTSDCLDSLLSWSYREHPIRAQTFNI